MLSSCGFQRALMRMHLRWRCRGLSVTEDSFFTKIQMGLEKNGVAPQNPSGFSSEMMILIQSPWLPWLAGPRSRVARPCNDDISCITAEVRATAGWAKILVEKTAGFLGDFFFFKYHVKSVNSRNSEFCSCSFLPPVCVCIAKFRRSRPQLRWTVNTTAGCPGVTARGASRNSHISLAQKKMQKRVDLPWDLGFHH